MPWSRTGDNAFTYPKLLAVAGLPGAPASAVNEVYGFFHAMADQTAAHVTDYVVNVGVVQTAARGSRWKKLVDWCVRVGLMTPIEIEGNEGLHWLLINDDKFIHIRTKAELEREAQHRKDVKNLNVIVPVRLRDGDNCRWCGYEVKWLGAPSNRSAEYDHLIFGKAATVDTLVVACRHCNGSRQDDPEWEQTHPLRPPPTVPNYGDVTARFLTRNGHPTEPNIEPEVTKAKARRSAPAAAPEAARSAARPEPERPTWIDQAPQGHAAAQQTRSAAPGSDGTADPAPGEGPAAGAPPYGPEDGQRDGPEVADKSEISDLSALSERIRPGRDGKEGPPRKRRRGRRGRGGSPPPTRCCDNPFIQRDPETGARFCLTCEKPEEP